MNSMLLPMNSLPTPLLALLGWPEIVIILMLLVGMAALVAVLVSVVWLATSRSRSGLASPPLTPPVPGSSREPRVGIRLSGVPCPKCGTALNPGAAGGLCPQCLLAVGLGTEPSANPPAGEGKGGSSVESPPTLEELAPAFPQLEIQEWIGHGGMGSVYRARQLVLDRVVALKVLSRHAGRDPAFAERFHREARALARLNHPNIVTVHDFGEASGWFYLVMELVDGADLRQVLQQGKLRPEEALRIVPAVCDALQYAHRNGVVHRDIKPGNILMDREGKVKIADFGIAKLAESGAAEVTLTEARQTMGTPHYMAPEQVENPGSVDHRADIYSLGVVFYEMLTGELPLGRFAPPSRCVQVDVRLDEVVLRTLEKEPARRYQQAGEVKTEVERIASGVGLALKNGPWMTGCRWLSRHLRFLVLVAILILVVLWAWRFSLRSDPSLVGRTGSPVSSEASPELQPSPPVRLAADDPPAWEMTPSGPVLTSLLLRRVFGTLDAPQREPLSRAMDRAWADYQTALTGHLRRSTNTQGVVWVEVSPMPEHLESITHQFWSEADAVLTQDQQQQLRTHLGPQLRPYWTGRVPGVGVYDTTRALFLFGDMPARLEFSREGSWYRHRLILGETHESMLAQVIFMTSPELPVDRRFLDEWSR